MIKRITIAICICIATCFQLVAQGEYVGIGFRAGLTSSRFHGPLENESEKFRGAVGFHIGLMVNFKFTDLVGLRTELNFSQRGGKMDYVGNSYYKLGLYETNERTITGRRDQKVTVTNSYLDIPLLPYYKFGPLEVFGGVNAGVLISSTAGGNLKFDADVVGSTPTIFDVRMQHNYRKDDAAAMAPGSELRNVVHDGLTFRVPETTGAYWDFESRDKALYKTLDLGLVVGLSLYLNESLFLSGRYTHGLTDIDRNEYDISLANLQNGEYIQRADKNTNRTFQFSIGFAF